MGSLNNDFIERLASSSPAPGGGAACACVGALASALACMVGNLTIGKKKYADVEAQMQQIMDLLMECRERLLTLMQDDEEAFNALAACWRMPKKTKKEIAAREAAEQKALVAACEVPLQIMRVCAKIIELDSTVAHIGNRTALVDAGAAAILAKAAMQAAALNVYANTCAMHDYNVAEIFDEQAHDLVETFSVRADEVYAYVMNGVVAP